LKSELYFRQKYVLREIPEEHRLLSQADFMATEPNVYTANKASLAENLKEIGTNLPDIDI
jgi:hypothetical protein